MMFATLDDLEQQVELLVFGKAMAAAEEIIATDKIVLVRGRVDHKDAGEACLIVNEAEEFDPDPEEVAAARERQRAQAEQPAATVRLRVDAARLPASVIADLKQVLENFPGESEVVLEMQTSTGPRRLRLGSEYRVKASTKLHAELHELLGDAALAAA
jgi:DNA polymerase-3 subunit alpha